jgi:hypothetical protein
MAARYRACARELNRGSSLTLRQARKVHQKRPPALIANCLLLWQTA